MNNIRVSCYSGGTYAESPRSFLWEGREHQVEEIVKSWLEPGERCFHVRTSHHKLFQLCYNETKDRWSAVEMMSGRPAD